MASTDNLWTITWQEGVVYFGWVTGTDIITTVSVMQQGKCFELIAVLLLSWGWEFLKKGSFLKKDIKFWSTVYPQSQCHFKPILPRVSWNMHYQGQTLVLSSITSLLAAHMGLKFLNFILMDYFYPQIHSWWFSFLKSVTGGPWISQIFAQEMMKQIHLFQFNNDWMGRKCKDHCKTSSKPGWR